MERMASPHGSGVHGDAVHVGGTDTSQRHASAIELLRPRRAAETFSPEARSDTGGGLRTNGKAAQEAFGAAIPAKK